MTTEVEQVDVLVVGAGLSGIGAAYQISMQLPGTTYAVLESRDRLGGTWDLFRYPGVRSDSDMHTLGYRFRPWTKDRAIADGASILAYLQDTARDGGVEKNIRYGHKVVRASWSSEDALWTVEAQTPAGTVYLAARYLFSCSGYYDYAQGYSPEFPGIGDFRGQVVHPQQWPDDLDYAGKRVVVIGSGATAVTLVPSMAERAAHVTMLQRSPTYIAALPGEDPILKGLRKVMPSRYAIKLARLKNIGMFIGNYQLSRRRPELMKKLLRKGLELQLPADYDFSHFTPAYNPWDQRLCVVPDGDLFTAIKAGTAEVVTDTIKTVTETGIRLASGRELPADIIVTATGLNLLLFGGAELVVDGEPVDLPHAMAYKAVMVSDVPNFFFGLGYTNASWTLKMDLTYEFFLRVVRRMRAKGETRVVPRREPGVGEVPLLDFKAGYVLRSLAKFPKAGTKAPWMLRQNYARDLFPLRYASLDDGVLEFSNPAAAHEPVSAAS
jgi:monooxygenase